jgi:hypothetical protein
MVNLIALLGKIGELMNIHWLYAPAQDANKVDAVQADISKPPVSNNQYKILIALAEIGYLSGFKNKFAELHSLYQFPAQVSSQINEYVQLCNFPQIIGYLEELCDE